MSRPPRLSLGFVVGVGLLSGASIAATVGSLDAYAVAVVAAALLGTSGVRLEERGLRRIALRSASTVAGAILLPASLVVAGGSDAPLVWTLCVGAYGLVLYASDGPDEDELTGQAAHLGYAFAAVLGASILVSVGAALPGGVFAVGAWIVGGASWFATRYVFGYVGMLAVAGAAIVGLTRRAIDLTPIRALRPAEDVVDVVERTETWLAGAEEWIPKTVAVGFGVMVLGPVVGLLLTVAVGLPVETTLSPVPGGAIQRLLWAVVVLLAGYVLVGSILRKLWRGSGYRVLTHVARAAGGIAAVAAAVVAGSLGLPGRLLLATPSGAASAALGVVDSIGWVQSGLLFVIVATVVAGATVLVVLILEAAGALPRRAGGAALAAAMTFVAALATAVWPTIVVGTAAALFVWDLGEHSATLADQVGAGARSARNELVHAGGNALVGLVAIGAGVGTAVAAGSIERQEPAVATLALVSLLAGALVLASLLRASRWGR